jgi:hypothetical protein
VDELYSIVTICAMAFIPQTLVYDRIFARASILWEQT